MAPPLAELLHDWRDFYALVGTVSATLARLMFVAVSIGTSIFEEPSRDLVAEWITPTVMHFAAVLLLVTIPTQSWRTLGLGAGGLAGLIYCGRLAAQIVIRRHVDLTNRLFYALLPFSKYVLGLMSAALQLMQFTVSGGRVPGGGS